jgi:streptomycin 6-kinase
VASQGDADPGRRRPVGEADLVPADGTLSGYSCSPRRLRKMRLAYAGIGDGSSAVTAPVGRHRIRSAGVTGASWFRLEQLAREVASEWDLTLGAPFALSNYSYVAPAGVGAVLKIRSPEDDESLHEQDALAYWAGDGAVRLLRADGERRALLLERACPGTDLSTLEEVAASAIAAEVAGRLWRPAALPFRWIGDHVPGWLMSAAPGSHAGRRLLARAVEIYDRLEISGRMLVHGDLHHHNIVDAGGRYVAIDPKPMLGEAEFDVPPFLWNPAGSTMTLESTERRLDAFAAIGLDQERMRAWALIRGAYLTVGDWVGEHAIEILEVIQS